MSADVIVEEHHFTQSCWSFFLDFACKTSQMLAINVRNDGYTSGKPVLEYTVEDNCGLMCLNDLHQTPKVYLNVKCR